MQAGPCIPDVSPTSGALEATNGKTYAELDREDPLGQTAMSASFLRAALFTSVVAFGVAAMAMGIGLMLLLIGWALIAVSRRDVAYERTRPAGTG